jgi:hypothetical protein
MGISKSHDAAGGKHEWKGSALVYSGLRDPQWPVPEPVVKKLLAIWDDLPASSNTPPDTARLGYRGAVLRSPSGSEWTAFAGTVSLRSNNVVSTRDDQARRFERTLLSSAPKGMLPEGKIDLK